MGGDEGMFISPVPYTMYSSHPKSVMYTQVHWKHVQCLAEQQL